MPKYKSPRNAMTARTCGAESEYMMHDGSDNGENVRR